MFLKSSVIIPAKRLEIDYSKINFNPTSTSVDNINDRDLLIIFITGLYSLSQKKSPSNPIPLNTCSLLMYKHVFSKFVVSENPLIPTETITYDPSPLPLPIFSHEFVKPLLTSTIPRQDQKSPFGIFPLDTFVSLILDSGALRIFGPFHQGLLLDGANIMAMMRIRYTLLNDVKNLKKAFSVINLYNKGASDKNRLSPIAINILNVLFKNGFGSIDDDIFKETDYITSEKKQAIVRFLHPDTVFEFDNSNNSDITKYNFRDSAVKNLWKYHLDLIPSIIHKNIKTDLLKAVLNELTAIKQTIINGYTKVIFEKLGGNIKEVLSNTLIFGDGSDSKALLDIRNSGINLFSYDFSVEKKASEEDVRTLASKTIEIVLSASDLSKKTRKIHFDVFAIDSSDAFDISITAYKGAAKVFGNFKLREILFGIGVARDTSFIPIDKWFDLSGNRIGYYLEETNDLIITDDSITKLDIIFTGKGNIDGTGKVINKYLPTSPEIILTVTNFTEDKIFNFSLDLDAETVYTNDRFEILSSIKRKLFWSKDNGPERENVLELIEYIKSNPSVTFETELRGNGVGMLRIPFPFKTDKTYQTGEYVLYNNKPYISLSNGNQNNNPSTSTANWRLNVITTSSYDYDGSLVPDFVFEASINKIHRLKKTHSSGVLNTINWESIAVIFNKTSTYTLGQKIIFSNNIYEARTNVSIGNFNLTNWKKLSRIEIDQRYQPFSKFNSGATLSPTEKKDTPIKAEDLTGPVSNTFEYNVYASLRYSFAEFQINGSVIKIIIDSFASPLISRLDKRMLGPSLDGVGSPATDLFDYRSSPSSLTFNTQRRDAIDLYTIAGKNGFNNTNFKVSSTVPSYNQILTALRCFGILDAITCRIKTIANDSTITTKMDGVLSNSVTVAETTFIYSGQDSTSAIVSLKYDDPTNGNGYKQLLWYTSSAEPGNYSVCTD